MRTTPISSSRFCNSTSPLRATPSVYIEVIMQAQKVEMGHGWLWITHGYRLIMRNPPMSLGLALLGALGMYLTLIIPVAGMFLALLLMPILLAGYMRVCRALEYHQKVEPTYLFAGFEKRTSQLLALGS